MAEGEKQAKKGCLDALKASKEEPIVLYKDGGDPVVYTRRWFVLLSVAFGYMAWNQVSFRHVPLVAEYARFYDTTNAFEPSEGELGIDFFAIFDGILVLLFYPIAGKLVDNFGLKMMVIGNILQALGAWWFYLAFTNYTSALLSRIIQSAAGPLIATSLLKVSMQWFPPSERPFAIGLAVLLSEAGAGIALLQADFFINSDEQLLDVNFKSCNADFAATVTNLTVCENNDAAIEAQCCLFDVDIDSLNLAMAVFASIIALFAIVSVRERPKTAPSIASLTKEAPTFLEAMKLMFSNRNYTQICIADFIMSGPPQVLFLALSRIVPASQEGNEIYGAAGALLFALPAAALYGYRLNKTKRFFEYTAYAYTSGFALWALATACLMFDQDFFDALFIAVGSIAIVAFVLWTVAVYELKEEYVFNSEKYLEGFIVGIDRAIINLSLVVFLSAIPPERADNLKLSGGQFTLVVGLVFMAIGTVVVWTTRDKREYKRTQFEMDNVGKGSLMDLRENRDNDFDHLNLEEDVDKKKEAGEKSI